MASHRGYLQNPKFVQPGTTWDHHNRSELFPIKKKPVTAEMNR